jgi:RNA polymerase sigma factor (sigma-70 family)
VPLTCQPRIVPVYDEDGKFLFEAEEYTARSIISRRAATLIRDAEGPRLVARRRRIYEGPDNGLGWLRATRHWPTGFEVIAAGQRKSVLRRCLEELPRTQRTVIVLRYSRDLKFLQIANALEVTEEAVIQMHQRTLAALRAGLEQAGVRKLGHIL